mgnify:CR=1 FL=1
MENIHLVYPEIFISLSIMLILMIGVFKTKSSNLVYSLSILVLFVSTGLIINSPINQEIYLFNRLFSMYI